MSDRTVCEHDINPVEKCPVCNPDVSPCVPVKREDLEEAIVFLIACRPTFKKAKNVRDISKLIASLRAAKGEVVVGRMPELQAAKEGRCV